MKFESLSLCEPLLRSLVLAKHHTPTPIQQQAIPHVLQGRDLVGCAQTGTGKTAAFALPTLQRLMASTNERRADAARTPESRNPESRSSGSRHQADAARGRRPAAPSRPIRTLVLAPTRELAAQIGESFATYGQFTKLRHTVIFGGVGQGNQVRALQHGVDILVATPGRLLDLMNQGYVRLSNVEILILDEADQMLDMGFIHDLRRIVSHVPSERQTLLFSATMPREIRQLASQWLKNPAEVHVAPVASTPELVAQAVYFVDRPQKTAALTRFLKETARSRTLVFSRTKRGADRIAKGLERAGIRAVSIHGDKSQNKREAVIRQFNSASPPVLVATDLAARGLDFSGISHVINFDLPEVPETYVHRIGRTARAGASGQAVSFCDQEERHLLRSIEKLTGQRVTVANVASMGSKELRQTVEVIAEIVAEAAPAPSPRTRQEVQSEVHHETRRESRPENRPTPAAATKRAFGDGIMLDSVPAGDKPRKPRRRTRTRAGQTPVAATHSDRPDPSQTKRRRFGRSARSGKPKQARATSGSSN
jgi:ATP-dependent RNA helicase RhlE